MNMISCLHCVGKIWGEIKKTAKYVVDWYNAIGLFNKQKYIVLVNSIVIIFAINNTL